MSPRAFHKFMVDEEIGRNLKLARLTHTERWCFVAGVLPLLAKGADRGALMAWSGAPADDRDVARQADVPLTVARCTIGRLHHMGILERTALTWVLTREGRLFVDGLAHIPGLTKRRAIPQRIRDAVMSRDKGRCRRCGATRRIELDHIVPWSHGGGDGEHNLQLLCFTCNREKGARL